ncbi:hypothetical protein I0C86_24800 [Plantactinospora sp. S1510]|uniref:Uncharacterized protein n=1 Tax=Plantactinospora alkalitolerans TaxID=2789879 RepID=A0ABS0H1P8_9ACTN|nr:hypothetical protein [Plantactinospora alkalitolerans]MBF9132143.1 hypothetical protein [Plantactinospora alkalitolerans]
MFPDLAILLAIAVVWLAAGVVAEGLPRLRSARPLRRRGGLLFVLVLSGLAGLAGVLLTGAVEAEPTLADQTAVGLALPAVPAVVVAVLTVRRLRELRVRAGAFAAAPETPAPPALRAAAAHPMIALPVQVTGLVMLPGLVTAAGLAPLTGPSMIGMVLTAAVLAIGTIGVRHALRHSRLVERAVTIRSRSSRAAGILHV